MKISTIIIPMSFVLLSCNAQNTESIVIDNYSSYSASELTNTVEVQPSSLKYDSIITDVLEVIGFRNSDIEIKKTSKFGAFSLINRNCRRRFFLYNEAFFDSVYSVTQSIEPIKSICFHEIAHHFYRHPLKSRWEAHLHELEADRYSGYQMRLIGATPEESIAAMSHFGNKDSTFTHPEKTIRINEIKAGYADASLRVFNDSSFILSDSLMFIESLMLAFSEVSKQNKSFGFINEESFSLENDTKEIFNNPTYNLLGKILIITDDNEVIDLATNQIVGDVKLPYENAPFELIRFETSTYKIEDGAIYSMTQVGTKIKLGAKIN
ncbi:MAG: hypothetical protein RIF33_20200 [Cyclobacteriaceae bacterium]